MICNIRRETKKGLFRRIWILSWTLWRKMGKNENNRHMKTIRKAHFLRKTFITYPLMAQKNKGKTPSVGYEMICLELPTTFCCCIAISSVFTELALLSCCPVLAFITVTYTGRASTVVVTATVCVTFRTHPSNITQAFIVRGTWAITMDTFVEAPKKHR